MSRMLSEGAARPNAGERQELGDFTTTPRLLVLSAIAVVLGAIGAVLALVLLRLIAFFTNIFFYGRLSFKAASPADSNLGVAIIIIPVIGALIIGLQEVGSSEEISEPVRSTIYRVVQESLTNVVKHAHASRVSVAVQHQSTGTTIDITDDGTTGPPPAHASAAGYGLAGMSRRVTEVGGTFSAGSLPEGGFAVHAHIPPGPVS